MKAASSERRPQRSVLRACGHLPPISRADRTQLAAGDQFRLVLPPPWNASFCPLANTGRIDAKATSNLGL